MYRARLINMKKWIFLFVLLNNVIGHAAFGQNSDARKSKIIIPPSIGITGSFGVGFKSFDTGIITEKNDKVKISAGGGMTIGLNFLTSVSPKWILGSEVNYHFTSIMPQVKNAKGNFNNWNYLPTIKRAFFFNNNEMAILVGGGVDFSLNGKFKFNTTKIPGGALNYYYYKSTIGPVVEVNYIMWNSEGNLGGNCGLRYTYLNYKLDSGSSNGNKLSPENLQGYDLPNDIFEPDGSGIDLFLTLLYSF